MTEKVTTTTITDDELQQRYRQHLKYLNPRSSAGRQLDLTGIDLRRAKLPTGTLSDPSDPRTVFSQAILTDADMSGLTLDKVVLEGAHLERTRLDNAVLVGHDLRHARLRGTLFPRARLVRVKFQDADLSDACFDEASLESCAFVDSKLTKSSFRHARLSLCTFRDAKADGADFSDSTNQTPQHALDFVRAQLCHARFERVDFSGVNMSESRLEGASFRDANLDSCNLEGSDLKGADFTRANLRRAVLNKTDVRNATFCRSKPLYGPDRASLRDIHDEEWAIVHHVPSWTRTWQPRPLQRLAGKAAAVAAWIMSPWSRIRAFGSLGIFGFSGVTVGSILLYVRFATWYNKMIATANQAATDQHANLVQVIPSPIPIPGELLLLLLMFLLVGIGSFLYNLLCPSIVRQYTEERWTRELKESRLEHASAAFSYPVWRAIATMCYSVGGTYIVFYTGVRAAMTLWPAVVDVWTRILGGS